MITAEDVRELQGGRPARTAEEAMFLARLRGGAAPAPGGGQPAPAAEGGHEPGTIYSGGTLMDILDTISLPFSVIPSAVRTGIQAAKTPEQESILDVVKQTGRNIKGRTFFRETIGEAAPEFAREHPWVTGGAGLALDVLTGGGPAKLATAPFRAAANVARPAAVAAAQAGKLGRAPQVYEAAQKLASPVARTARKIMGRDKPEVDAIMKELADPENAGRYQELVTRAESALDDIYRPVERAAEKEVAALGKEARPLAKEIQGLVKERNGLYALAEETSGKAQAGITRRLAEGRARYESYGVRIAEERLAVAKAGSANLDETMRLLDDPAYMTRVIPEGAAAGAELKAAQRAVNKLEARMETLLDRSTRTLDKEAAGKFVQGAEVPGSGFAPAELAQINEAERALGQAIHVRDGAARQFERVTERLGSTRAMLSRTPKAKVVQAAMVRLNRAIGKRERLGKSLQGLEEEFGREAGINAPFPRPAATGVSPQFGLKPATRELPPGPTTPWERPNVDPRTPGADYRPPGVERAAERVPVAEGKWGYTQSEKLLHKATKLDAAIIEKQQTLDLIVLRGQERGLRRGQLLGGESISAKAINHVKELAVRGKVPEAHAAAETAIKESLERIRATAGDEVANKIKATMDAVMARAGARGRGLKAAGLADDATLEKYGKFHIMRAYEAYQHPEEWIKHLRAIDESALADALETVNRNRARIHGVGRGGGVPKALRSKRGHLTREEQAALGELPVAERFALSEAVYARGRGEAFRLRAYGRQALKPVEFERLPARKQAEYVRVSVKDSNLDDVMKAMQTRWGPIEGKYIPRWMAADLGLPLLGGGWEDKIAKLVSYTLPAMPGEISGGWALNLVGTWKGLHTWANLPTQGRNIVTNGALTYIAGKVPAAEVVPYMWRGMKEWLGKGKFYQQAVRHDAAFTASWTKAELNQARTLLRHVDDPATGIEKLWNGLQKRYAGSAPEKMSKGLQGVYEAAEMSAKMGVYMYHVDHGMSGLKAAKLAALAIFDYGDVSRITNFLRRSGVAPFVTFPLKSAKAMGRTALESPERLGKFARTAMSADIGVPEEKRKQFWATLRSKSLGGWQSGRSIPIPLPAGEGEVFTADVGYYMPWGPMGEGMSLTPLQMVPMWHAIEDLSRNSDSFTGKPIFEESMDGADRVQAGLAHLAKNWSPYMVYPGIPQALATLKPKSRYAAPTEEVSLGRTARSLLGSTVGVRVRPYAPKQELVFGKIAMQERERTLKSELKRYARQRAAGQITDAAYEKKKNEIVEQIRKNRKELAAHAKAYREASK